LLDFGLGREYADDFEDALQYECAKAANCDVIITNNGKDYTEFCDLPLMTAAEFLVGWSKFYGETSRFRCKYLSVNYLGVGGLVWRPPIDLP